MVEGGGKVEGYFEFEEMEVRERKESREQGRGEW